MIGISFFNSRVVFTYFLLNALFVYMFMKSIKSYIILMFSLVSITINFLQIK